VFKYFILVVALLSASAKASIFGEETIALLKLVALQTEELSQLSESVGATKDQTEILKRINEGVTSLTRTIDAIDEVVKRAKDLDPKSVRRISDLTRMVEDVKELRSKATEVLLLRTLIAQEAVSQGGLQAETAYSAGGEMVKLGKYLNDESAQASPGRASQISASAASGSVVAQGVQLQTLSQIAQMQAISLELQRSEIENRIQTSRQQDSMFLNTLSKRPDAARRP
jgi:hypothetical protein